MCFIRADKDPLQSLEGELGTLVGFTKKVKYVMDHQVTAHTPQAGVYSCLGDAVLRLDNGQIIRTALIHLEPEGYRFDDFNIKNFNYLQEAAKHKYLGPLPHVPYNYGDKVIVAQHGRLNDDALGTIVDTLFKGSQIFYLVDLDGNAIEVAKDKIIDVLELGEHSEHARYLNQMKTLDRIIDSHMKGFKHCDEESNLDNPWLDD